ncbi:MAG: DUF2807 domain-containing protein [Deltaproteobacteria bacterium]|nr:DUF2807 domain-containing protein [Deltaproteobacteria bacterium]
MHATTAVMALALGGLFGVKGNGTIKTEAREIGQFQELAVGSGIQARVSLGKQPSLTLEGDENLLPLIEVRLEDGALEVRAKESLRPTQPLRLILVTPQLTAVVASGGARVEAPASPAPRYAIAASGGSHVEVQAVQSDELVLDASGGSSVKVSGKAKAITASASGGAKILAGEVPVDSAAVNASGGARVEASVRGSVTGSASGGSSLHLRGQPEKKAVTTSGGSRVVCD